MLRRNSEIGETEIRQLKNWRICKFTKIQLANLQNRQNKLEDLTRIAGDFAGSPIFQLANLSFANFSFSP